MKDSKGQGMCSDFSLINNYQRRFYNHWKVLQHKVCIFCAETVKTCAAASEYIFMFQQMCGFF